MLINISIEVDAEGEQLSAKLLDLFGGECNGIEESKILAHTPYRLRLLMFVPFYQTRSCLYILRNRFLAQHVLPGIDCFFDYDWLNAYRQRYDDGINILTGEEIIKGMIGCGRRVIVCSHGFRSAFGKLIGGRFGARVDGFEGEERCCLDSWEMLCIEADSLVRAIMTLKGGEDTDLVAQRCQLQQWQFRLTFCLNGKRQR